MTPGPVDEFDWIASLRSLTRGDHRALDLRDDVAVLPAKPGFDLVISKDAMVEGVHFLPCESPEVIGRRLLRTSLSDLAAKAAEPFGYFLMTAWPRDRDHAYRQAFASGLELDGRRFGIALLGGDTVATTGPLTVSATVMGWVEAGGAVLRSGARPGDRIVVCGTIGDGTLGLAAARGEVSDPGLVLATRYRLPEPLFFLRQPLLRFASGAADVSDGLLADVGHIASASSLGAEINVARLPLSKEAGRWLTQQQDQIAGLLRLATGGDDYAVACAVEPAKAAAFMAEVRDQSIRVADVGEFVIGAGLRVSMNGVAIRTDSLGWRH